jgi:hypothetical protein
MLTAFYDLRQVLIERPTAAHGVLLTGNTFQNLLALFSCSAAGRPIPRQGIRYQTT